MDAIQRLVITIESRDTRIIMESIKRMLDLAIIKEVVKNCKFEIINLEDWTKNE